MIFFFCSPLGVPVPVPAPVACTISCSVLSDIGCSQEKAQTPAQRGIRVLALVVVGRVAG